MKLYPRLASSVARQLAQEYRVLEPATLTEAAARHRATLAKSKELRTRWFVPTPTGGVEATEGEQAALREALMDCARSFGWDAQGGRDLNDDDRRGVDRALARVLFQQMDTAPTETAEGGTWGWMSCLLAPELVRWRFAGDEVAARRFEGGRVRNLYGRLWWRAWVLYDPEAADPWALLDGLGEDEVVQLTERASIATQRPVAQAIARAFIDAVTADPGLTRQDVFREVGKHLRRQLGILVLDALEPHELAASLEGLVGHVAEQMGSKARRKRTTRAAKGKHVAQTEAALVELTPPNREISGNELAQGDALDQLVDSEPSVTELVIAQPTVAVQGITRPCPHCAHPPGMHKCCPRCGVTANGKEAIGETFGFRQMGTSEGAQYTPQTWCRACRRQERPPISDVSAEGASHVPAVVPPADVGLPAEFLPSAATLPSPTVASPRDGAAAPLPVSTPPAPEPLEAPLVEKRTPAQVRRDSVLDLEPSTIIERLLRDLNVKTVGDVLKLDIEAVESRPGVGPRRVEALHDLKRAATRHLEVARCMSLPVLITAAQKNELKRFYKALLKEGLAPGPRLERIVDEVARVGVAEPIEYRRPGRRPAWRITFGAPEGPEVDLEQTLAELLGIDFQEIEGHRPTRLRVARVFCERWNAYPERPPCYLGGEAVVGS